MNAGAPLPAARTRVLPVAEIFSVQRAEHFGLEAVVTVVVGDAEHTPHTHGLRAPVRRWAEIFAALRADPVHGPIFERAVAEAAAFAPAPRLTGAPVVVVSAPAAAPGAGEVPPCAEPGNAYFRAPIEKPAGGIL